MLSNTIIDKLAVDSAGCWLWTASLRDGYGQIRQGDRVRGAHVVVYESLVGEVPAGCEMDHLCRRRHCVNPDHLEPVTHAENLHRSPVAAAGRHARARKGVRRHAKLAPDDVVRIRARLAAGESCASIAAQFRVTPQTIANVRSGRTWSTWPG